VRVSYASSTLALAALEYFVHVDPVDAPSDLIAVAFEIPTDTVNDVESHEIMPADWRAVTAPDDCRQIGADWIGSATSLGLAVPSVVIPSERNLLLNPAHADMRAVRVRSSLPFQFDPRLLYRE